MNRRTVLAATAASALAVLLVAGCGGEEATTDGGSAAAPSASGAAEESGNGVADLEAEQIMERAKDALAAQETFRMEGGGTSKGEEFRIDMAFVSGEGATGTIGVDGGDLELLVVDGKTYIKGSGDFLAQTGITGKQAEQLKGKWLMFPASQASDFESFTDGEKLADEFFDLDGGQVTKGGTKDIDGIEAVALVGSGDEGTLWIATEGEPLPLLLEASAGDQDKGSIRFFDYGAEVELEAPAASDVVDFAKLLGGGASQ